MSVPTPDLRPPPPMARLDPITLGVREAAATLCLSPRTVESMAAAAELPSFKVGRRRLFHRTALEAWAAAQTAAATAEGGAP